MLLLPGSIIIATYMVLASAVPLRPRSLETLTSDQVSEYTPFTYYAAAVKCGISRFDPWNCGVNCQANPNFQYLTGGGDGSTEQYWYVGYDPVRDMAIVAHQGTNRKQFRADLTDLDLFLSPIDTSLFPGASSSIKVHNGFAREHSKTASQVYNAVNQVINTHGTSTVTVIGQSLGGALGMLDAVSLRLQLPSNIGVNFIGYGVPRVGNQDWADFVDEKLPGNVTRITNQKDPIPIMPGRSLGYHHPSGEIHIQDSGTGVWVVCTGQENDSSQCTNGEVKTIFSGIEAEHDGPYNGIMISC